MLEGERVQGLHNAVKDRPTVTSSGELLQELIEDVLLRPTATTPTTVASSARSTTSAGG